MTTCSPLTTVTVVSQSVATTLTVVYETYDILPNPCTYAETNKEEILTAAGLSTASTWTSCSVASYVVLGGVHVYTLTAVVSS